MPLYLRPNEAVRYPGYFPERGSAMHRGEVTGRFPLGLAPATNQAAVSYTHLTLPTNREV